MGVSIATRLIHMSLVRSARTAPPRARKATCNWRVVDPQRSGGKTVHPPKRPCVLAADVRPRVWTGVRHAHSLLSSNAKFIPFLVPQCRERTNFLLHSPPWRKIVGESLGKVYTLLSFCFPRGTMIPALGAGGMIAGKTARSHFQCRFYCLMCQFPTPLPFSRSKRKLMGIVLTGNSFSTASVRLISLSSIPHTIPFQPCAIYRLMQAPCQWTHSRCQKALLTLPCHIRTIENRPRLFRTRVTGILRPMVYLKLDHHELGSTALQASPLLEPLVLRFFIARCIVFLFTGRTFNLAMIVTLALVAPMTAKKLSLSLVSLSPITAGTPTIVLLASRMAAQPLTAKLLRSILVQACLPPAWCPLLNSTLLKANFLVFLYLRSGTLPKYTHPRWIHHALHLVTSNLMHRRLLMQIKLRLRASLYPHRTPLIWLLVAPLYFMVAKVVITSHSPSLLQR